MLGKDLRFTKQAFINEMQVYWRQRKLLRLAEAMNYRTNS